MKIYASGSLIANRYEVASRPMMGGMGVVYVCLDRQENRPVALKTFKPEYLPDRAARDRFLREGTHWINLGAHPHIVRCYDVESINRGLEVYLSLELIASEQGYQDTSLRSWLSTSRPLALETALLFALQMVRGMKHAVKCIPGFVHRDLKPENILVGADKLPGWSVNHLRVTDFGLVKVLTDKQTQGIESDQISTFSSQHSVTDEECPVSRTQLTHGAVGTPLYMAPEQWKGQAVGVYTDVYALGCMLYEMLTGQFVVAGNSWAALQRAHCSGDLRPLPKSVPVAISDFINRCLVLEPTKRYETWDAVEGSLATIFVAAAGHPVPREDSSVELERAACVATGWSYNSIGVAYLVLGKVKIALNYFESAMEVGRTEQDYLLEATSTGNIGLAYGELGESQRAIDYCEQHLAMAQAIDDQYAEQRALNHLGEAYRTLSQGQKAIGYYEKSLIIARRIGYQDGEGGVLGNLGLVYANLGEIERAIEYYKQALAIARQIEDRHMEGTALGNLGTAYSSLKDIPQSISYHEQHLDIAREIGDRRGEGNALGNLGQVYRFLGETGQAIHYLEQQLNIVREIGDRLGEGNALGNLGNAYRDIGDMQQAINCYEHCLVVQREIGDRRGEGKTLGNLGTIYRHLEEVHRSINFIEQYLTIAHEVGDQFGKSTALGNLGLTYAEMGDTQRAISYYEQALTIARTIKDIDGVARHLFNMALLYAQQGQFARAFPLAQEAARTWTQIHSPEAWKAQQLVTKLQERFL